MGRAASFRALAWTLLAVLAAGCGGERGAEPPVAEREPVEVEASVDRAVLTTGDLLTYRIVVDHDPGWEVEVPEAGAEIAGFRIVDARRDGPRAAGGRSVLELEYRLRADLVGSYVLPPVVVGYRPASADDRPSPWTTVATSEIFVEVESVLPADGSAQDIRDIKPLTRVRRPWPWRQVAGAGLALLVLAAGYWLYRRWRSGLPAEPLEPAHEAAFRALDALRELDLTDPRQVRRFYFRISEVVRTYVERRWGFNATDLTTEEILVGLSAIGDLAPAPAATLAEFLRHTDRVKFAEHRPVEQEIRRTWEAALGFVEATLPAPVEELAA